MVHILFHTRDSFLIHTCPLGTVPYIGEVHMLQFLLHYYIESHTLDADTLVHILLDIQGRYKANDIQDDMQERALGVTVGGGTSL